MIPQHGPPVAVVVATFNRSTVLRRALWSVIHQTYQDWVCYVVADGCTDDTDQIMDVICKKYPGRFEYVNLEENLGQYYLSTGAGAKDFAIGLSKEPWIAYLDDDNEWEPEHLGQLVGAATEQRKHLSRPLGLVFTDMKYLTGDQGRYLRTHTSGVDFSKVGCIDSSEMMTLRAAVEKSGGWTKDFPSSAPDQQRWRTDDYYLCRRIIEAGYSWHRVPKPSVLYWDRRKVRPENRKHLFEPNVARRVPGLDVFPDVIPTEPTPVHPRR